MVQTKDDLKNQGKKNRARGARFELKVREDLESDGWTVAKWTNNVDLEKNILISSKRKYNPYTKFLSIATGFPDFIAFRFNNFGYFDIIGVEVKRNGSLDKVEREKFLWYLKNKIFTKVFVAKAKQDGRKVSVEYIDAEKRLKRQIKDLMNSS